MSAVDTPDFDDDVSPSHADVMESYARQIMALHGVTGGVRLSRPGEEEDEPQFAAEDVLQRPASIWVRKNIPNN
jgi:hypothetical protein